MNLKIKEICKDKGITITLLANKLNIKQESLSRTINGNPTFDTLKKIASALDVHVSELFTKNSGNTFQCPKCGAELTVN